MESADQRDAALWLAIGGVALSGILAGTSDDGDPAVIAVPIVTGMLLNVTFTIGVNSKERQAGRYVEQKGFEIRMQVLSLL